MSWRLTGEDESRTGRIKHYLYECDVCGAHVSVARDLGPIPCLHLRTEAGHDRPTDPAPAFWFDQPEGGRVALADKGYESDAGWIDNLKHYGVPGTVSVLFSKAGSRRASHLHRLDSHFLYVVSGEVHYYERDPGDTDMPPVQVYGPREAFFTPPMREHLLLFPIDTVMVSLSNRSRTHEEHEADVLRVKFP